MAPHSDKMKLMRVVVREDFTKSRCDALIQDFKLALQTLDAMDKKTVEQQKQQQKEFAMQRRSTLLGGGGAAPSSAPKAQPAHHFEDDHSLQGKSGKTHAVC
jgi:glutamate decarboxylase